MVSGVDGADYTVREMLIEMRGTLKLIQSDNARTNEDIHDMKTKHHALSNEVQRLIADRQFEKGAKYGFERTIKAVYALATISGIGGIAAAAKILLMTH